MLSPLCGLCTRKLRTQAAQATDKRLKLIGDILDGIQYLKAQALENKIEAQIEKFRKREIKLICGGAMIKSFNFVIATGTGYLAAGIVFLVKVGQGEPVHAGPAFALLSTFSYFFDFIVCCMMGAVLFIS